MSFAQLATLVTAIFFAAGYAWLSQLAGYGHVHVTEAGQHQHSHTFLGEHIHEDESSTNSVPESESEKTDTQTDFFAIASVAPLASTPLTGLPALTQIVRYVSIATTSSPRPFDALEAEPRAPPSRYGLPRS